MREVTSSAICGVPVTYTVSEKTTCTLTVVPVV